ncbi:MAG: hypothetical protein ACRCUY_00540 [Thermoguttaceae bacterium]
MKTDIEIQKLGYDILSHGMESVEFERFLVIIKRGNFDYTRWRQNQFHNMSVDEVSGQAEQFSNKMFPVVD